MASRQLGEMLQSSVTMHTAKGIYISLRRGRQFKAAGPLVVCAAAAAASAAKWGQLHGFHRDLSKAKEVARRWKMRDEVGRRRSRACFGPVICNTYRELWE